MDKTVLIEQTSKRLKRWELIVYVTFSDIVFLTFGVILHKSRIE